MSIINEVLAELEKRGVNPASGDASLRAVFRRAPHAGLWHAALGAAAVLALGAAYYLGYTESGVSRRAAAQAVPQAQASMPPVAQAVSAPVAAPALLAAAPLARATPPAPAPAPAQAAHDKPARRSPATQGKGGRVAAVVHPRKQIVHNVVAVPASPQEATLAPNVDDGQQLKTITPQQRAESEYRKASQALVEGKIDAALAGYRAALAQNPARKDISAAWASVLISLKRDADAENVLRDALAGHPHDSALTMLLARSQVERGELTQALDTLQQTLPYAAGQAEYQAFLAAVLQRLGRHKEALANYQNALKLAPGNGVWLMGMGISLQALQRAAEARAAYQHALASNTLNTQLQGYVQNRLLELSPSDSVAASAPPPTH